MDNSSNTTTSTPTHHVQEYKIVLYCVLLLWSLVGNILVVAVIVYNRNLRTCFNYLVLNMTISDLLTPLLSLPLRIHIESGAMKASWPVGDLGDILCKICYFLTDISPTVSIFTLVVIAFERFAATVYLNRVYIINKKKTLIFIALTWILASAIYTTYLYGYRENSFHKSVRCKLALEPKYRNIFEIILMLAVLVIPFISIATLYTTLLCKLHQASKEIAKMLDSRLARARHRRNQHTFCLSLIIIVAFAVLWGPMFVFLFVESVVWRDKRPSYVDRTDMEKAMFIIDILGLSNACINPCIYFSFQKNYRQGLRRIWHDLVSKLSPGRNQDHRYLSPSSPHAKRNPTRSTKLVTNV